MSMVCPQCQGTFAQRLQCPTCGVRLEYQSTRPMRTNLAAQASAWQQTPWGRIVIGIVLSQGLYYGLWNLCSAGVLAVDESAGHSVWSTLAGLLILQGLQAVGLLIGGALAGAGQRQSALYGGIVGVWNGIIFVCVQQASAPTFTPVILYGQPILQTAFGALGGFLGGLIWRPLQPVAMPKTTPEAIRPSPPQKALSLFAGPIAWGRVLAGAAISVGGAVWANAIFDLMLEFSAGKLTIDSTLQAQLVTWEITALAMLLGSAFAGATTANGMKQGLFVGLGAASILAGMRMGGRTIHFDQIIMTVASTLVLCMGGGWFGTQLFPPLAKVLRSRNTGPI
jgi:hypothetical protein